MQREQQDEQRAAVEDIFVSTAAMRYIVLMY